MDEVTLGADGARGAMSLRPPVAVDVGPSSRRANARALVRAARPRQWPKNLLVIAAPIAAGIIGQPAVAVRTAVAALAFTVASAGVYLVNDVVDAPSDRAHPTKAQRPIAAGELAVPTALAAAGVLFVAATLGAGVVLGVASAALVVAYVAISLTYSLVLKRIVGIELAALASGFVLRAALGAAANHIAASAWFLAVASSVALFVAAGKRSAELDLLGARAVDHREVLSRYNGGLLRGGRMLAAIVAMVAYGLWAFERAAALHPTHGGLGDAVVRLSTIPFVLMLMSVERALEQGRGGAPEELALRGHRLQLMAGACLALVVVGIYA